jgi:hypothetical protein
MDRRQNSRNKRQRSMASSFCLPPVGPVARRDGDGGHRAREIHAGSFPRTGAHPGSGPGSLSLENVLPHRADHSAAFAA